MAKKVAPKATAAARTNEASDTNPLEKREKPIWRHSPFASEEIGIASQAPEFVANFAHAMVWNPNRGTAYLLGQLLASAIVHGALIREEAWQGWIDGLPFLKRDGELLWIDIHIGGAYSSLYRWFADPTTRILIHRCYDLELMVGGYVARECLNLFLAEIPGAPENQADRASSLLTWAIMHWRLRLPPLLLDQARGRLPTVTISSKVWLQVLGMPPEESPRSFSSEGTIVRKRFATSKLLKAFNEKGSLESRIFEEAKKLRDKGALTLRQEKNLCVRQLNAALTSLSPGRRILAQWAIARLSEKRARPIPNGFAPSTVRQWLISLLEGVYPKDYLRDDFRISQRALNRDIESLTNEAENIIMPSIKSAQRNFCQYLASLKSGSATAKGNNSLETWGDDSDRSRLNYRTSVSAKIISPEIFGRAVQLARDKYSEQAALVIIIGFRCGLRFDEIAGLQVHDFIIKDKEIFELHLQRNRHRELKTFESRRIIPLDVLLTTNEQDELRAWLGPRRRYAQRVRRDVFCFGLIESSQPISRRQDATREILNGASENEGRTYDFGHLRHSFGSYLLASLLLPEDADHSLVPKALDSVVCWRRGKVLSDRMLGKERLGQAALHAVSQMMGHTGIYRTLESYQHLLDIILGFYVSRKALQPAFPPEVHSSLEVESQPKGDHIMRLFANAGRYRPIAPRDASRGYVVPLPPRALPAPTSRLDWLRFDLRCGSKLYGLAPVHPHVCPRSGFNEAGWLPPLYDFQDTVSDLANLDWNDVWTIVTSTEDETKVLRHSISLSDTTFETWLHRYREISSWCFTRQTKRQDNRGSIDSPQGVHAVSITNELWRKFSKYEGLPEKGGPLLRTFLYNFDDKDAFHARFDAMSDAVRFAAVLRKLGVDGRNITIAQGAARNFKALKSGKIARHDIKRGRTTLYRTWDVPTAFLQKSSADHRPALWISHTMHDESIIGWSFDLARAKRRTKAPKDGRPVVHPMVNYAYRFVLAMMAIVDDDVWVEPREAAFA